MRRLCEIERVLSCTILMCRAQMESCLSNSDACSAPSRLHMSLVDDVGRISGALKTRLQKRPLSKLHTHHMTII